MGQKLLMTPPPIILLVRSDRANKNYRLYFAFSCQNTRVRTRSGNNLRSVHVKKLF